jgi:hypothetical protein
MERCYTVWVENYSVAPIENKATYPYLLEIHYAKRIPSISYAFGLFHNEELVGVVTYGSPPTAPTRSGVAGEEYKRQVLELNRLCLKNNRKNEASFLVSKSLKLLPKNMFILSFADPTQGHTGYVYQAANFKYYGLSAKRTDWALKSRPEMHGQTVTDLSRGQKNRVKYMKDTYGDDFYLKSRPRKHRYIFVTGDKRLYKKIKYQEEKYPKKSP